jgi:hypothetical protein
MLMVTPENRRNYLFASVIAVCTGNKPSWSERVVGTTRIIGPLQGRVKREIIQKYGGSRCGSSDF